MFLISERVFVQWTDDGNGKCKAYADKHRKKAFFFFSLSNESKYLKLLVKKYI